MNCIAMPIIFEREFDGTQPNETLRGVPTGTFGVESWTGIHGTEVVELCEVPLEWLRPKELPNVSVVETYAEWWRAGYEPPPIHVTQTDKGTLRISNGHHRFEAAKLTGKTTIRAWVSWLMWAETGMPTGLTLEALQEVDE